MSRASLCGWPPLAVTAQRDTMACTADGDGMKAAAGEAESRYSVSERGRETVASLIRETGSEILAGLGSLSGAEYPMLMAAFARTGRDRMTGTGWGMIWGQDPMTESPLWASGPFPGFPPDGTIPHRVESPFPGDPGARRRDAGGKSREGTAAP